MNLTIVVQCSDRYRTSDTVQLVMRNAFMRVELMKTDKPVLIKEYGIIVENGKVTRL